jgi:hypothetical protein
LLEIHSFNLKFFVVYLETRMKKVMATIAAGLLASTLVGCGGGGAESTTQVSTQTLGQELTDLKAAYESGAMTESEYESARKKLLNKYN